MADENEQSGGGGVKLNLSRKLGPFPLYVWIILVGGLGLLAYKIFGSKLSGTGATNPGQGTQFSSTTTSTNPQTGVSTSYTASGNGYLPGMLTTQAGPMPTSGGDIYINYPAQNNTTTNGSGGVQDTWPETYGRSEIAAIQQLVGTQGYTQSVVDDVQKAYDAEVAKFGQPYADLQHYSYIGPGNVQAIPRHLTALSQISTGLPANPHWGDIDPASTQNVPQGLGQGT